MKNQGGPWDELGKVSRRFNRRENETFNSGSNLPVKTCTNGVWPLRRNSNRRRKRLARSHHHSEQASLAAPNPAFLIVAGGGDAYNGFVSGPGRTGNPDLCIRARIQRVGFVHEIYEAKLKTK
jgi:hypothetical protein